MASAAPPKAPPASPRDIAEQIAAVGGIMTLPGVPLVRKLVGQLRWMGERRVFWFTAFGESSADAQALRFDRIEPHPAGVCFNDGGRIAAFLAPIEKAGVEDPADYRVAWKLWQEVAPAKRAIVESAFAALASNRERSVRAECVASL